MLSRLLAVVAGVLNRWVFRPNIPTSPRVGPETHGPGGERGAETFAGSSSN